MSKDDGGPAFAAITTIRKEPDPDFLDAMEPGKLYSIPNIEIIRTAGGMSLRDYFAAVALSVAATDEAMSPTNDGPSYQGTAERAYLYANAMLRARAK
jgi:hypothetical protein